MKRLEKHEVLGLEKFLVEDSDEVIGITLHLGMSMSNGEYTAPETIKEFTKEALAGGDLIPLDELRTLCALVGNRLYYRDVYGHVGSIAPETTFMYHCNATKRYLYGRIIVLYSESIEKLPDEEILSRKTILVKDNKRVSGIQIERGHMGLGGTNRSGFSATSEREYTAQQLSGSEPIWVMKSEICALVNDVLYFRCDDGDGKKRVYTLDHREEGRMMVGEGIAYDTASAARVVLLLK